MALKGTDLLHDVTQSKENTTEWQEEVRLYEVGRTRGPILVVHDRAAGTHQTCDAM